MENSPRAIERRGLSYATEQKVGQRLSQTGAMIKENRPEVVKNTGMKYERGSVAINQSTAINSRDEEQSEGKNEKVRGGPILFWLVAGIAVTKDILDVGAVLIDAVGAALTATVVGAPLGVALLTFSEVINKIAGMFIDFTIVAYFGYIGGGLALRLVIMSIGALVDMVPVINILPLTTISFFAAYLLGRTLQKTEKVGGSTSRKISKLRTAGKLIKRFI